MSAVDLVLKPGEEDRLLKGHPWIFREELARVEGEAEPGCTARLLSGAGQPLGVGHYNPLSKIAFRFLRLEGPLDRELYFERLKTALDKRTRLYPGETAYRLCFGESDGLPGLSIDRYGDYLVVQLLSAGMDRSWPLIEGVLIELLRPAGILLRNDSDFRRLEGLSLDSRTAYGVIPAKVEIKESGLRYAVPLGAGQKTGFYFDQRENRAFLKPHFKGRRVADLHCYLGAFALTAAAAGADPVFGLDSSERAVELAKANAELNGLEDKVWFGEGEAAAFLNDLAAEPPRDGPDFILLDPPNFAQRKGDLASAERAYVRLGAKALRVLPPGGLLSYSTCARRVTRPVLERILAAAARQAKRRTRALAWRGQAQDHPIHPAMPETEYLHLGLVEVLE